MSNAAVALLAVAQTTRPRHGVGFLHMIGLCKGKALYRVCDGFILYWFHRLVKQCH
jgi:hypothetical protein